MWELVRRLRDQGVTIILTTHYIEEAQEMADRVGVIRGGKLILVEDKHTLMRKLGTKQLRIELQQPLDSIPADLGEDALELVDEGRALVFTFDAQRDETGIAPLLRRLHEHGIDFKGLQSSESSLEDIFVRLVRDDA
jgi:ABC-2 type transport system ATP-binding protein